MYSEVTGFFESCVVFLPGVGGILEVCLSAAGDFESGDDSKIVDLSRFKFEADELFIPAEYSVLL